MNKVQYFFSLIAGIISAAFFGYLAYLLLKNGSTPAPLQMLAYTWIFLTSLEHIFKRLNDIRDITEFDDTLKQVITNYET